MLGSHHGHHSPDQTKFQTFPVPVTPMISLSADQPLTELYTTSLQKLKRILSFLVITMSYHT